MDSVRKMMVLARFGLQNWEELGFYGRISETEILSGVIYSTDVFAGKNILHLKTERVGKQ